MAVDAKYGRVTTEYGDIGDDEQIFIFRAQDEHLPMILAIYLLLCTEGDSPRDQLDRILDARDNVLNWQVQNSRKVKAPDP